MRGEPYVLQEWSVAGSDNDEPRHSRDRPADHHHRDPDRPPLPVDDGLEHYRRDGAEQGCGLLILSAAFVAAILMVAGAWWVVTHWHW